MSHPFRLHEIAEQLDEWVKDRFDKGGCYFNSLRNQVNLYADHRGCPVGLNDWQIDLYIDADRLQGLTFGQMIEIVETEIAIANVTQ